MPTALSHRAERRRARRFIRVIRKVAKCPCVKHQAAFLAALQNVDRLICKARPVDTADTTDTANDSARPALTTVVAKEHTFVLTFPTMAAARRHDPSASYVALARDTVFRMVLEQPELTGVLVTAASDRDAWASATRSNIEMILDLRR